MATTPDRSASRRVDDAAQAAVAATVTAANKARSWARANVGTRMPGRDRTWRGTHTIIMLNGLDAPGAHALRSALRQLASLAPDHRIFQRPGHQYTRWLGPDLGELDERCDRMVVPLDAAPGDLDALQKQLHDGRSDDLPFRIATGHGTVAGSVEHPLADGHTLTLVLSELIRRAGDGRPPLELARSSVRRPLARAVFGYYGRAPRRVVDTLRTERDVAALAPSTGAVRIWSPDFTSVSMTSDRATLGAVWRWRVANAPGVTRTSVLFAAVRAAVEAVGLVPAQPGYHVLADNRKYLPARAVVDGNFSVGVYVEPTDPLDPAAISDALDRGMSSARPLATMATVTARSQRHRPPEQPLTVPVPLRPALVVNYLGRLRPFEQLPWRVDATPRFLSASTPGAPEHLTFVLTEVLGRLHVTAGFNASSFDPNVVRRAVKAVATDPTGVLDAVRGTSVVR